MNEVKAALALTNEILYRIIQRAREDAIEECARMFDKMRGNLNGLEVARILRAKKDKND